MKKKLAAKKPVVSKEPIDREKVHKVPVTELVSPKDARAFALVAAGLAGDAEKAFKMSEKATNAADRYVLWGEARALAELATAHAQVALALREV